jgi:16S rRNA processing protein RimM
MASSSRFARAKPATGTEFLTIGLITAPHGLRGEVRVRPETDFPERLATIKDVYLIDGDRVRPAVAVGCRPHGAVLLMRFEGVDSLDDAERLRGAAVSIPRSAAAPLGPDTYYVHEILGMRVTTEDGRALGVVAEVLRTAANDVYVVRGARGEILVPALRAVVRQVDRESREMRVTLPAGLEPGPPEG